MDFYQSKKWKDFRKLVINNRLNDKGETICEFCHKPIFKPYDIILHHIVELSDSTYEDANISLNQNNIMIVHHKCHNIIHGQLGTYRTEKGFTERKVYIVYGPPRSGKSEYVKSVAECGDIILDIENIWECISGQDKYIKPNGLKYNVFNIRDKILEDIQHKVGYWRNAYIVGGYKMKTERERLATILNAELIYINTSKDICLERAVKMKNKEAFKEWINEWFELNDDISD